MESVSINVKKALLERDDDEWEEPEYPQSTPNAVWEGLYDITADEVIDYRYFLDEGIDPETDEWNGIHEYVAIEVKPEEWNEYYRSADYFNPAEYDMKITSYEIYSIDDYVYTTNEYNGKYYFEGDEETIKPFQGFTEKQIESITEYIEKNVDYDYWDWDYAY